MDPNSWWAQILIAVLGGAVAAVLTAVLAPIVTDKLAQRRKRDEVYRTNIGNQINTLYLPLLEILKKLEEADDNATAKAEITLDFDEEDEKEYREELLDLTKQIHKLLDQGKETYLTTKLEKRLKSFLKFMQDSIELADERIMWEYQDWERYNEALVLIHTPFSTKKLYLHTEDERDRKKIRDIYNHAEKKKKEIENIIHARVISGLFNLRFRHDIHEMKALIKEVVQDSPHNPSPLQNP